MKIGKNQILLPSGVATSKDGKYHYWECSVSGLMTFAKPDYWVKIMAKFGSEENLVKTYVCKKAQKLLDEGLTKEEIRARLSKAETYAQKKERKEIKQEKKRRKELTKRKRKPSLKTHAVGAVEVAVQTDTGSFVKEKVPVYPWQTDPNYFKSIGPGVYSVEDVTRDACLHPSRYLDDECRGCPVYDRCQLTQKFTAADWKKGKSSRSEIVIKPLNSFSEVV